MGSRRAGTHSRARVWTDEISLFKTFRRHSPLFCCRRHSSRLQNLLHLHGCWAGSRRKQRRQHADALLLFGRHCFYAVVVAPRPSAFAKGAQKRLVFFMMRRNSSSFTSPSPSRSASSIISCSSSSVIRSPSSF